MAQPTDQAAESLQEKENDLSVRTRLHMDILECHGQCQHQNYAGVACVAPVDVKVFHARTRPIGVWVVRKPDACCGILKDLCEEQGCCVEAEIGWI